MMYFSEEKNGYSKEEVDKYIGKLNDEYQLAFVENRTLVDKYEELFLKYQLLEAEGQSTMDEQLETNADIITKTLLDAEVMAQKIIRDARMEAAEIIRLASTKI